MLLSETSVKLGERAQYIHSGKYAIGEFAGETWEQTARRVAKAVMRPVFPALENDVARIITQRKFMPGGRYLYASGRPRKMYNNCLLLSVEDSKEGWSDLYRRANTALCCGAGIGVVYSNVRPRGSAVGGMGGEATGPLTPMVAVDAIGSGVMQGGSRRAAIWAGLHWNHPDVMEFIHAKSYPEKLKEAKAWAWSVGKPELVYQPLENTNISVILDDAFFAAYARGDAMAHEVYSAAVSSMLATGEPGFSIDTGVNAGEHLRNACTEISSRDDNDICNLGSIVLPRIAGPDEMAEVTELGTAFLLAGSITSDVPYAEVAVTREKNRRLGLGIMGFAEWFGIHGKRYGPDDELGELLNMYEAYSSHSANYYANQAGVSTPVKTRAIAPTGTISMLAETTSGIEPVFSPAYLRRYVGRDKPVITVDDAVRRMLEQGADASKIEGAAELAADPERRLKFQVFVQEHVDHGISSTLNLPQRSEQPWTDEEFGKLLMPYLPRLRGITSYPDGARGGQPLTPYPLEQAILQEGLEFEENSNEQSCVSGSCGL